MILLDSPRKILCRYTNYTAQIQIIRISNIPHSFFERTVIPKSSVLFETLQEARLEVHTGTIVSSILSDTIPCYELIEIQRPMLQQAQFGKQFA